MPPDVSGVRHIRHIRHIRDARNARDVHDPTLTAVAPPPLPAGAPACDRARSTERADV